MQNITEIKNEYTTFLTNILTPFIYEGIKSTYSYAIDVHNKFIEKGKFDATVKSPGVLKLFQLTLKEIPTLNNASIEVETNRIKSQCKCADWFDDLVRSVVKSNIILLTFSNPKKRPEIIKEEFHNKIDIKDFIHKCYIESARQIYNNPELFWHEYPSLEIKRNQREACNLIQKAIEEAIRRILPVKLILKEYLQNNFEDIDNDITKSMSDGHYMKIQSMINRDLHGQIHKSNDSVLESASEEDYMNDNEDNKEIQQLESNLNLLEKGINEEEDYMEGGDGDSDESESDESGSYDGEGGSDIEGGLDIEGGSDIEEGELPEEDNFMKSVQKQLESAEGGIRNEESSKPVEIKQLEPKKEEPKKEELLKPEVHVHSIPKAENDTEVKKIINGGNVLTNLDKPRKKLNAREQALLEEIDKNNKPPAPDKKSYFEQYMK